ncbi:hypothetical protein FXO38_01404 [Capsicum annuum]|nr:hypothetical protein FXO38_01404 [Capsicum annuum]
MAELLALRCGLIIAKEHNIRSFDVEMYSVVVIKILTNNHPLYFNIVSECRTLLEELGTTVPIQIFMEQNVVVVLLAKEGTKSEFMARPTVVNHVPSFATILVENDCIGKTFNLAIKHLNINLQGRIVALSYPFLSPTFDRSTNPPPPP